MKWLTSLFFYLITGVHTLFASDLTAFYKKGAGAQVRPFITDDARVVGWKMYQLESWVRLDHETSQHWNMAAFGPVPWMEISLGGVYGLERPEGSNRFAYGIPLVQAKVLARPYQSGQGPGLGWVVGSFLPGGEGSFRPPGYGAFTFLTVTQCWGKQEDLLLHLNTGYNFFYLDPRAQHQFTWGMGTQLRVYKGFHLLGEVFSGDPYVPGSDVSWQAGFRHFFSADLQIDGTVGEGVLGAVRLPFWTSAGVRWVFAKPKGS